MKTFTEEELRNIIAEFHYEFSAEVREKTNNYSDVSISIDDDMYSRLERFFELRDTTYDEVDRQRRFYLSP